MTPQPLTVRISPRGSFRIRSRRAALIGAIVVLGLTACGSPDSSGSSAASTLPAPAVIQIAGTGSSGGEAPMAADAATAESKMMPMSLSYAWSGEAPALTSPAASWFFAPGIAPTAEQAQQLAAAFGVTGDVVALAEDMGGGWTVGPTDGSAPSITIARDAMQSWWFSPAWSRDGASGVAVADCAYYPPGDPAGDPTTANQPLCEEPQPPAGVPTGAEAETKARELLTRLGGDPARYELETYADEWGASVTAFLVLDGVRSNLSFNVGYGEQGAVTWAGGFLAAPQRGPDYPRIGVEAAVQRLNDQASSWMTGYGPALRDVGPDVAVGSGTAGASGTAVAGVATAVEPAVAPPDTGVLPPETVPGENPIDPTGTVTVEPMPVDCTDPAVSCLPEQPIEPSEPMVMTLTTVAGSLEQVWAADGTVWLLPGYTFGGAEGLLANVLAVEDKYLEQAEPQVLVDPVPLPEPMPVETAVAPGAGTDPAAGAGSGDALATIEVVGLSVDEATKLAADTGWSIRTARQDGIDLPVTADFRENRINVAIEAGMITEVLSIG